MTIANQCMGCQAGWPRFVTLYSERLWARPPDARHTVIGGYPHELISCTADHYRAEAMRQQRKEMP